MIIHHIGALFGRDGDLVGDTPYADRGVVVALNQKLLHLADAVLPAAWHMLGDIRNLRPNDHTVFIAEIVEILIVLIVSKANGVGAYLTDHSHIGVVMILGNSITNALPVLMAANTAQGIGLAVKEEALVGIDAEGTTAEITGNPVHRHAANKEGCLAVIEIGILNSVPEMNLVDYDSLIIVIASAHDISLCIAENYMYVAVSGIVPGSDPNCGILACNLGTNSKSASAIII